MHIFSKLLYRSIFGVKKKKLPVYGSFLFLSYELIGDYSKRQYLIVEQLTDFHKFIVFILIL